MNPIDIAPGGIIATEYLSQLYVAYSFLYWLGSFLLMLILKFIVGRRTGKDSVYHRNLKLPWFLSLLICSGASVWILSYAIRDKTISPETANFFFVPYFASLVYFLVVCFRAMRDYRVEVLGGKSYTLGEQKRKERAQAKSEIMISAPEAAPQKEKQAQQRISYKKKAVAKAQSDKQAGPTQPEDTPQETAADSAPPEQE